eukprot:4943356-Amphidinium_carterae.1
MGDEKHWLQSLGHQARWNLNFMFDVDQMAMPLLSLLLMPDLLLHYSSREPATDEVLVESYPEASSWIDDQTLAER